MLDDHAIAPFRSTSPADWTRDAGRLRDAWEAFLSDGTLPRAEIVRPAILSRWQAAREQRIDPALHHVPIMASDEELERILVADEFATAGRRVLDDMTEAVSENQHTLLLTDARGCVLYVTGEPDVTEAIRDLNCAPGGRWDEPVAGPNGMGSALRTGAPAIIYGAEHFCERWQRWVCYGVPVHDPLHGGVLGIVNLTGWASKVRVNQLPLTMSLARSIEYLLAPQRGSSRQALLEASDEMRRRFPSDQVFLCDGAGNAIGVSEELRRLFEKSGLRVEDLTAHPALRALSSPNEREREAELFLSHAGLRVAARAVTQRGRYVGAVLVVRGHDASVATTAPAGSATLPGLAGEDPRFRAALRLAERAARSRETVLLFGETGTGKELVAKAIHALGPRAAKPLVAVNCAALPRELAESELFGYERGAFTGADRVGKTGRFELAHGGTLFLDEIGELPLDLQGKLLRALDERTIFPLGGTRPRTVDVRIIAATNRDLAREVSEGRFRLDLYHRLSVLEIALPPLRERTGDVLLLAEHFLAEACEREDRPTPALGDEVRQALGHYPWPGNVRELRNVATHLAHWAEGETVHLADLPARLLRGGSAPAPTPNGSLRALEDEVLERTLGECDGNMTEAARRLGIDRSTVYRRLRARGRKRG